MCFTAPAMRQSILCMPLASSSAPAICLKENVMNLSSLLRCVVGKRILAPHQHIRALLGTVNTTRTHLHNRKPMFP